MARPLLAALLTFTLCLACSDDEEPAAVDPGGPSPEDQAKLLAIEETEEWTLPGLEQDVHVVRTEAGVPRVYAHDRLDLGRTLGFVVARDRYFVMDLQRRMGLGTLTELLGDVALDNDLEARHLGLTYTSQRLLEHLSEELGGFLDAFAGGMNTYIEQVKAGKLVVPKELELAGPLVGADDPADLMRPFDRKSLAAMAAVIMYETNFEKDDVGHTRDRDRLATLFEGVALQDLRRAGLNGDLWANVTPLFPYSSAAGLGIDGPTRKAGGRRLGLPAELLTDVSARLDRFTRRLRGPLEADFGSNSWAVAGSAGKDGASLLAGDGHLALTIPGYMYQVGLDTRVFGGGRTHQAGLLITGLPVLAVGTNGRVAWSMTNPGLDITDWYREEIQLDGAGAPKASRFAGEWKPLVKVDEVFEIADVPVLGSKGRTETWSRWTTFDGRWISEIEGRRIAADEQPGDGETVVNFQGKLVVPGDADGDDVITALSFDHASFDATQWLAAMGGLGYADDVYGFQEATKGLVGGGLFNAVADANGSVLYTSYQSIPCRSWLERSEDGVWGEGADPKYLLDGTRYGGFAIQTLEDGKVDEAAGETDSHHCVVPFDAMPQSIDPESGFVVTANNDPGGLTKGGSLDDDEWHIGGPWYSIRADSIRRELQTAVDAGTADLDKMAEIQAYSASRTGEVFAPYLVAALDAVKGLAAAGDRAPHEQRAVDLYNADAAAFDSVALRLKAWGEGGYRTPSGVETFYHTPADGDAPDSVATMIWNAWFPRYMQRVWDDEGLPWFGSGSLGRLRALRRHLEGRGADNPGGLGSWNPDTAESAFFDVLGTDEVERSDELVVVALADALTFLRSAPTGVGEGGFGTDDMDAWIWGMRHQVRFKSLLQDALGDDPMLDPVFEQLSITSKVLPLAADLARDDPRWGLKWFPRAGDNWAVDAASPGLSGTRFTHGSGAVMRMAISFEEDRVRGFNVIPGGQSAHPDSPHFADQARLWLGNQALPLRYHVDEVVEGATGREVYRPE